MPPPTIVLQAHVKYLDLGAVRGIHFVNNCYEMATKTRAMALIYVKPVWLLSVDQLIKAAARDDPSAQAATSSAIAISV
jgi:hypothetical protein